MGQYTCRAPCFEFNRSFLKPFYLQRMKKALVHTHGKSAGVQTEVSDNKYHLDYEVGSAFDRLIWISSIHPMGIQLSF